MTLPYSDLVLIHCLTWGESNTLKMLEKLRRYWWYLLVTGLLFVGLGLQLMIAKDAAVSDTLLYLGYVLTGMGVMTIVFNILMARKKHADWRWYAVGAAELTLGVIVLIEGKLAETAFIYSVGVWAIIMGITLTIRGLRRKPISTIELLSGIVSLVFAALILFDVLTPEQLLLVVGLYAALFGLYSILMSFKVRRMYVNSMSDDMEETDLSTDQSKAPN